MQCNKSCGQMALAPYSTTSSARAERGRHFEAKRFGGPEVDHEFEFKACVRSHASDENTGRVERLFQVMLKPCCAAGAP